ncbi:MAG: HAMP domain-containing histidine kinase [Lentisphaerae bacterium]|nr:HAMP domain-containing histidine kinase [Lentisphaerota bacterium]
MHGQSAHTEAARHVLDKGSLVVTHLADQPVVRGSAEETADWAAFAEQVRAMHALENGLQYVSVTKHGVTVFQKQTQGLADSPPSEPPAGAGDIAISRRLLDLGGETVPVVVFTRHFIGEDGTAREVEVAVRKDTVVREEQATTDAIGSMFKLSLVTVLGCFGVCVVFVAWMMRREAGRERQRREEEHLAFAGVLANGIVHDFRNPMSAMRLDVQMLNREAAKGAECRLSRVSELSGRVQQILDRMDKVFQEFLYMSKPPSDQREATDLCANLRECATILRPRFEEAGVTLDLDLPPQPMPVLAYSSALQRAFMNVLTNAEQASPRGSAVRVRVLHLDHTVSVDIVDAGPGVPESERQRIFEMFYTTRPSGTGLGLFLARTAIERCGGTIRVLDAAPSGGACFRITLPLP